MILCSDFFCQSQIQNLGVTNPIANLVKFPQNHFLELTNPLPNDLTLQH
jgi:hypothetical protein